jgi:hypothetical protein
MHTYLDSALATYRIGEHVNFYEEQEKEEPCQRKITRLRVVPRGAETCQHTGDQRQEIARATHTCPM